ncbi:chloramphenicol phosphotransferase [Bradyrhizobium sp. KB893862 SZCCT0404]|uniref:chloramphenicol phosphotransferase CPT family protein n=1 Tax=Bradyrhizobium sp. KB893862 SZCCT0404 TaxID=2807672 RepID=UPI001BA9595B|nr:chloramphenicol phosphotransferase [Bradyrhizobium sp. KB893862 SZCCT0404]MBR1175346.1 chloramphenicol phosphotransferase [Bradyrhizobium sp. KB893862 SZCCT0404]
MNSGSAGQIVILNGPPRSGKSSIVKNIDGPWINLGVDVYVREMTPSRYQPGIGVRPGGERPDLEPLIPVCYAALYESIAAHSRLGPNVVVDVGHHNSYARPVNILVECARRLLGLPVLFVGVRCSIEVIMERRRQGQVGRENVYLTGSNQGPVPAPVLAWQQEVHVPGIYDLEIDTSSASPQDCAATILQRLENSHEQPTAFEKLAASAYSK